MGAVASARVVVNMGMVVSVRVGVSESWGECPWENSFILSDQCHSTEKPFRIVLSERSNGHLNPLCFDERHDEPKKIQV